MPETDQSQLPIEEAGLESPMTAMLRRYGLPIVFVAVAYGLTLLTQASFLTTFFFAAVVASAWFCGPGAAWFTIVLSTLTVYFFFGPRFSFLVEFVALAVVAGVITSRGKRAEDSLQQARRELQMRVVERTSELRQTNEQLQAEVAERQRTELMLRNQTHLLDLTHDSIFVRDIQDVITYWNRGAEQRYGWSSEEALGQITHDLLHTVFPEPLHEIMAILLQTGHWTGDLIHTKRDGNRVTVASRWSLERDERGQPIAILETNNDITQRKRAEEAAAKAHAELAHVTRVMTMGEMAASIAHEINQPLSGVVINSNACLRWLAGNPPNLEEAREAVQRIERDGKRAGEVIARIRALSRKTSTEKEPLDLNVAIEEVVSLAHGEAKRYRVTMRLDLAPDLPRVVGDRVQLQQVMLNLIINGVEAMHAVTDRSRELLIKTGAGETGLVQVSVRDSGTGLEPQQMDRIFDAFYTTKAGGMGMGLSISRSIITNHGGQLWAIANDGPGTIFQFTVPVYQSDYVRA